jgi:hypothetical protein
MDLLQRTPGPLVVNNSWCLFDTREDEPVGSPSNYSENPNHPFNQVTGALVAAGRMYCLPQETVARNALMAAVEKPTLAQAGVFMAQTHMLRLLRWPR